MAVLNAFLHFLHIAAAITWVGGMVFAAFILQPVMRRRMTPAERMSLWLDIGLRYRWIHWGSFSVLLATGLHKIFFFGYGPQLFVTSYGTWLGIKLILFAAVFALSYHHAYVCGPRLAAVVDKPDSPEYRECLARVSFWGRVNFFCNAAIIVIAAFLRMHPF